MFKTNRRKEQVIINRKFKFNFSILKKNYSKVYRCTEYRTKNKCKFFIILNDKKETLKNEDLHNHNHLEKESQIARNINKKIPPDVTTFDTIPNESKYYKTERNENFMIFKNSNIIIFQSPFQTKLFIQYNIDIFADGTFKIAPKCGYQVFITKTYVKELNKQRTYEVLVEEIKKNAKKNNNIIITPKNFHCDFEKDISNTAKKVEYLEHKYDNFLEFLEYFEIIYLNDYEIKHWNYYDNIEHIANYASESFNN
ncbi:hypothetical protein U3516DRAFT_871981 [Neocallimastix sp. 'constans']